MNRRLTHALFVLCCFSSTAPAADFFPMSAITQPLMFFSNSVRRDADNNERRWVVNARGCAAFFVRNKMGKTYVGSAKHCFNYDPKNWCSTNGALVDNDGKKGKCKDIVAYDSSHDIILMEASFDYTPLDQDALELSAQPPKLNDQLLMIGYPADPYRQAKLTVTENCWVLTDSVPSPHASSSIKDRSSRHNCTTYGGNSGGPMLEKGTQRVLGLPFTYMPNDFHLRDPNIVSTSSHLAQMADFVSVHRTKLDFLGISIIN